MKIRKLTREDVAFSISIEPEHETIRGNAMASGDDAFDRKVEARIQRELDSGNQAAWCCIRLTATWVAPDGTEISESVYLGCVSCYRTRHNRKSPKKQVEDMAREHDMHAEALDSLNETLANMADRLGKLAL